MSATGCTCPTPFFAGPFEHLPDCPTRAVIGAYVVCPHCSTPITRSADGRPLPHHPGINAGTPLDGDEPYVVSEERLREINGLIDWKHSGWQTVPKPGVTVYDLAAAVEDLLAEREESRRVDE